MTAVPDLTTGRVRLRRLEPRDAADLHLAFGDPASMQFWDSPPTRDTAETEARIRRSLLADPADHVAFAIQTEDRFLGMVNYHARNLAHRRLGVGWIVLPDCAGLGYVTEAMTALLAHCFGTLQTHRVEAEIAPDNARSLRLAERLGFRREGLLRDRLQVGGESRSMWMCGLLAPEWHAVTSAVTQVPGAAP